MAAFSRRKLAQYIVEQLDADVAVRPLAERVVAYLAAHKQIKQLELLLKDVAVVAAEQFGTVPARVVTARPLDAAGQERVAVFIKTLTGAKTVTITDDAVDPTIIGGLIIETPDSVLDASVRTKLNKLTAMKV